jgi:hypothetical protein
MILGFNCFYSLFRLGSPPDVGGVRIAHHFSFLWCMFYYVVFVIVVVFTQCFQSLWIVHYWLHVRVSLTLITCNIPMFLLCPYILSCPRFPIITNLTTGSRPLTLGPGSRPLSVGSSTPLELTTSVLYTCIKIHQR